MKCEELRPSDEKATPQDIYRYQWKVGSLLYTTTTTRPDAACTANKLSEFLRNPSPHHQAAVNRAISYLYGTRTLAIEYSGTTNGQEAFACASDVAFADDILTRHSTEGYLFKLFGGAVDWRSTKQKTVTTSTTEAELLALSHAAKEVYGWRWLFQGIGLDPGHELSIACDNAQTIRLLTKETPKLNTKLRHVDIHHHWLRQEAQGNRLQIYWVRTADMTADGLTKGLPNQKHENFIRQIGLTDVSRYLRGSDWGGVSNEDETVTQRRVSE